MATNKILAVVTNVKEYDKVGYRTGLWLGELTHFYDVVTDAGYTVDIASPTGGFVPIDPASLAPSVLEQGGVGERYRDRSFMDRLNTTRTLGDIDPADYDAIFFAGGHGTVFDFPNGYVGNQAVAFDTLGKVVSAVCHGPAALLEANKDDGTPLIQGRKVTGFSWAEEKQAGRDDAVPFDLGEALANRGADYEKGEPGAADVVTDGNLVTGQNPASAHGVGEAVLKVLGES